jgi:ketosteroid isomerase-like protein
MDAKLAVAQRRDEFVSAFNREDVSALCALCEPDVIQLPPNQPPVIGANQSFEWWTTGFTACRSRIKIVPRELHVYGDTALDWFDWAVWVVSLQGGTPLIDRGHSFWIWRQQNGVWRLWRTMWNSSHEVASLWAGGAALFPDTDFPTLMGPVW